MSPHAHATPDEELTKLLVDLEAALLDTAVRQNAQAVSALLHPDFFEFGRSGRSWTRSQIIERSADSSMPRTEISSAAAVLLADNLALLTYRSTNSATGDSTLRSSLWVLQGASWLLRFHQGTPCA